MKSRSLIFCADYCGDYGCNKRCSWPASTRLLLSLLSWWKGCIVSFISKFFCVFVVIKFQLFSQNNSNSMYLYWYHMSHSPKSKFGKTSLRNWTKQTPIVRTGHPPPPFFVPFFLSPRGKNEKENHQRWSWLNIIRWLSNWCQTKRLNNLPIPVLG